MNKERSDKERARIAAHREQIAKIVRVKARRKKREEKNNLDNWSKYPSNWDQPNPNISNVARKSIRTYNESPSENNRPYRKNTADERIDIKRRIKGIVSAVIIIGAFATGVKHSDDIKALSSRIEATIQYRKAKNDIFEYDSYKDIYSKHLHIEYVVTDGGLDNIYSEIRIYNTRKIATEIQEIEMTNPHMAEFQKLIGANILEKKTYGDLLTSLGTSWEEELNQANISQNDSEAWSKYGDYIKNRIPELQNEMENESRIYR